MTEVRKYLKKKFFLQTSNWIESINFIPIECIPFTVCCKLHVLLAEISGLAKINYDTN